MSPWIDRTLGGGDADGKGLEISVGRFGSNGRQKGFIQVALGNLGLVGQRLEAGNSNGRAVHADGAVLGAGGNEKVNHLVRDGEGRPVDLDALQDIGLAGGGDKLLDLAGHGFNLCTESVVLALHLGRQLLQLIQSNNFGHGFVLL